MNPAKKEFIIGTHSKINKFKVKNKVIPKYIKN